MSNRVPAAPQSSFAAAPVPVAPSKKPFAERTMAPLDAAFLNRVFVTTLWFGALLSLCVGGATKSVPAGCSFEIGTLLAAALLKSQSWFVRRLVSLKTEVLEYRGWDARFPLWLLVPLKYLGIAALIGLGLKYKVLVPEAFAAGYTVLQVVIFARIGGRLLKANVGPIHQHHAHR